MPGEFSKFNRPVRPGAYFNFEAAVVESPPIATGSIVAVPFTHDWGPFKTPVLVGSWQEFVAVYGGGPTAPTPGVVAVKQAFKGEGVAGRGGAGGVLCYRTGGSAAAKAAITLQNTAGTPANAITLTARFEGTKGNALRVTVQDSAFDSSYDELIVYDGTVELERYVYPNTNVQDLADQINGAGAYVGRGASDWITAGAVTSGTSLALVTAQPLVGGNSGTTLASGDWTALMTALEPERFAVFAPYDLTDSSILTSLKTWAVGLNSKGKRFEVVVGGALNEVASAAASRAASLNDPNIITLGVGSVVDEDTFGIETTLSTSQLAPRIAGILAGRGESLSLTFARLEGISRLNGGATESEIAQAFDAGVVVLARDSHPTAPIRVEKGLTTYTTKTNAVKPYAIYRQPKYLMTMQSLERELTEYAEANVIGLLPVNDKTRQLLVAEFTARVQRRVQQAIIQPARPGDAPFVQVDPDPPPSDNDEFVALVYALRFGRSVEQVFNTVRVG